MGPISESLPGGKPSLFVGAPKTVEQELEGLEQKPIPRRLRISRKSRHTTQARSLPSGLGLRQIPDLPPLPPRLGSDCGSDSEPSPRTSTRRSSTKRKSAEVKLPGATREDTAGATREDTGQAGGRDLRFTAADLEVTAVNTDGDFPGRPIGGYTSEYTDGNDKGWGDCGAGKKEHGLRASVSTTEKEHGLRASVSTTEKEHGLRASVSTTEKEHGLRASVSTTEKEHGLRASVSTTESTPKHQSEGQKSEGQNDNPMPTIAPAPNRGDRKLTTESKTSVRLDLRRSRTGVVVPKMSQGDQRRWFWIFEDAVAGAWFEPFFAGLILLNTCVMAAEMQYKGMDQGFAMRYPGAHDTAKNTWPEAKSIFEVCEWFFGSLFLVELVIKFIAMRSSFFKEVWNWLDFIIVAFWCIGAMGNSLLPLDPTLLRLVRVVRLMRLLRLVKTLQGFESLYLMTTSIKASMLVLVWSAILLVLLQMCIALVLNQLLLGFVQDDTNAVDKRERVYRYFGTFSRATLTMFEFMLANWPPSSRVLTEDVNEFYLLFVLSYQCIISFAVVKVIMGVFLQVTFNVAATDDVIMLNQKERAVRTHTKKMDRLFKAADQDGNGLLDKDEFREMVDDPVVRQWLSSMDCDVSLFAKDADVLFQLVDDGDEELTAEELVKGVARMQGPARSIDLALLADDNRQISEIVQELSSEVDSMKKKKLWSQTAQGARTAIDGVSIPTSCASSVFTDDDDDEEDQEEEEETVAEPIKSTMSMQKTLSRASRRPGSSLSRASSRSMRRKTVGAAMFKTPSLNKQASSESIRPSWLEELVRGPRFETFFGFFIVMNIMVMAVEVQYMGIDVGYRIGYHDCNRSGAQAWPGAVEAFEIVEWIFLVIFTLEVSLKIIVLNCSFFKDLWHWFDLFLVSVGMIEATFTGTMPLDASLLRLARIVRLMRILRMVRKSNWFDSVYLMCTSIIGSLQALMWFSVLMFVVQMLIAIVVNMLLESYMVDVANPKTQRHLIYKYFGTFSKAILTMFEITLANWIPVCRALTENVSEWYVIFALVHKFIIGFAVVMVITGVFLQETFKVAATDDTIMINQKMRQISTHTKKMDLLFRAADEDGNGVLDRDEFKAMVEDPNVVTWLSSMGLDVTDADDLFTMVNRESAGDDEITAADLVRGVARLKGFAKSIDMAAVLHSNTELLRQAQELQAKVTLLKEQRKTELENMKEARKNDRSKTIS